MKNFFKARIAPVLGTQSHWLCAIALAAVIGLSMAACNDGSGDNGGSSGLAGTWGGYIGGYNSTITVTSTGWTMTAPGFMDSGTYTTDSNGITSRLRSTVYDLEVGTAILLDRNTISITLNQNSIWPGTHTLIRR